MTTNKGSVCLFLLLAVATLGMKAPSLPLKEMYNKLAPPLMDTPLKWLQNIIESTYPLLHSRIVDACANRCNQQQHDRALQRIEAFRKSPRNVDATLQLALELFDDDMVTALLGNSFPGISLRY